MNEKGKDVDAFLRGLLSTLPAELKSKILKENDKGTTLNDSDLEALADRVVKKLRESADEKKQ